MKRGRKQDDATTTLQEAIPVPPPEQCSAALQEFERIIVGTDLVDLRETALLQWLQSVPAWVTWITAVTDVSRHFFQSTQASPASGGLSSTPHLSTPLASSVGLFPSAPLRTPYRPRIADPSTSLMALATTLRTVPWRRACMGRHAKADAVGEAFEVACMSLLQCSAASPVLSVPVVEACLAPYDTDIECTHFLGMVGANIAIMEGDNAFALPASLSSGTLEASSSSQQVLQQQVSDVHHRVAEASNWFGDKKDGFQDVERTARIINAAASYHREKIVEVLQRTVASHFPLPRWPISRHAERYVELLLRLAGLPQPPRGFVDPNTSSTRGAVFSVSPAMSPAPSSSDLKAEPTSAARSPKATPTPAPQQAYPIAIHSSLLLDMVLTKLVDWDNALTLREYDAAHVRRLRRLVSFTVKILHKAYRQRVLQEGGGGESEAWLQALFIFHQQRIMPVSDTKAVHMLVPMFVTVCTDQDKASFLHGCISFAEKSTAYNIPVKATCVAHLGPLLGMLGSAFARRDPDDPSKPNTADEVLCGMTRRLIKMIAKAAKATTTAGSDRFAEGLLAVVTSLSERFGGFPVVGRGDLSESQVKQLGERAAAPGSLADIRGAVRRLYDDAVAGAFEADYGEKAMNALKRLSTLQCTIEF